MKLLVAGTSGFIGSHLAEGLAEAGHDVVAVSRRDGIDMARLTTPAAWLPLLEGVDAVVNAVGIIGQTRGQSFDTLHTRAPIALFHACADAGVRRVVQISALGADATAFSAYHLSKRTADDALRGLDLDWFVLRPALVYGCGGTSSRWFHRLAALPLLIPVIGDGRQLIQPVHVGDVVDTVVRCLTAQPARLTLDVVGPRAFELAEWLRLLRAAQGLRPAPLLRLPRSAALAAAAIGHGLSPLLRRENLRMLEAGNTGDPRPWEAFMGRAPAALAARRRA